MQPETAYHLAVLHHRDIEEMVRQRRLIREARQQRRRTKTAARAQPGRRRRPWRAQPATRPFG